jgi:cytochrome c556
MTAKPIPYRAALLAASALAGLLWAGPASAQFAKAEEAIQYRQEKLKAMGEQSDRLGAMVRGKVPFDAQAARESAETLLALGQLPWPAFAAGFEGGKAKPEVWKEAEQFKAASERFKGEAAKLAAAARTGDLERIKAAFGDTADTCRACHREFRNR